MRQKMLLIVFLVQILKNTMRESKKESNFSCFLCTEEFKDSWRTLHNSGKNHVAIDAVFSSSKKFEQRSKNKTQEVTGFYSGLKTLMYHVRTGIWRGFIQVLKIGRRYCGVILPPRTEVFRYIVLVHYRVDSRPHLIRYHKFEDVPCHLR